MGRFESDPVSLDRRWRRLASTGRLSDRRDRSQYVHNHDKCDCGAFVTVEGTQDAGELGFMFADSGHGDVEPRGVAESGRKR